MAKKMFPIESAPKDGSVIIGENTEGVRRHIKWHSGRSRWAEYRPCMRATWFEPVRWRPARPTPL